jgi:hypothetical protein
MEHFAESIRKGEAKSLPLDDLEQIAKQLAFLTSKAYPGVVGGSLQIGRIENGVAKVTQQRFTSDPKEIPNLLSRYSGVSIDGGIVGVLVHPPEVAFVDDSRFQGLTNQPLDNIFFFNTTFDKCVLWYDGSRTFIFDKSNTVTDSDLIVTSGDVHSKAVEQIKKDFPNLRIRTSAPDLTPR